MDNANGSMIYARPALSTVLAHGHVPPEAEGDYCRICPAVKSKYDSREAFIC